MTVFCGGELMATQQQKANALAWINELREGVYTGEMAQIFNTIEEALRQEINANPPLLTKGE